MKNLRDNVLWALFALLLLSFAILWLVVLPFVGLYFVTHGGAR